MCKRFSRVSFCINRPRRLATVRQAQTLHDVVPGFVGYGNRASDSFSTFILDQISLKGHHNKATFLYLLILSLFRQDLNREDVAS